MQQKLEKDGRHMATLEICYASAQIKILVRILSFCMYFGFLQDKMYFFHGQKLNKRNLR